MATNLPELAPVVSGADRSRRSRAWNDKRVTAHHAIIPTVVGAPGVLVSPVERKVYDLVARRYVAQFLPPLEFYETRIELDISGEHFRAAGRQTIAEGWRQVLAAPARDERRDGECDDEDLDATGRQSLPLVRAGDPCICREASVAEKKTQPPKRFTDATLLEAMTGISRFVDDPKIKQLLRETDGIGTPATQADIIETLFERRFIERRGRQIRSTPLGRALIGILPKVATRPDMTALWEAAMRRIADSQLSLSAFLEAVTRQLSALVDGGRVAGALTIPGARACGAPGCTGFLRRRQGPRGIFWSCTRFPECKHAVAGSERPRQAERRKKAATARRGPQTAP